MDERRDKTMGNEVEAIRKTLFLWLIVFVVLMVFLFPFSLTLFQKIYSDLVPQNIKMLITNPLNPFFIQIQVAAFFAFLLSLPVLLYRVIAYLFPALYNREKKAILESLVPSGVLFISGCFFAYFLLVPLTLRIMSNYDFGLNAAVYFEINQFITFALMAIFVSGIAFILPIFMKTLTFLGIVNSRVWLKNFKYSLIAIVILTAIITPDGTGVTMLMLSIPLICLYLLGCCISKERTNEVRSSLA